MMNSTSKKMQRVISAVASLAIVATMFPVSAFADEAVEVAPEVIETPVEEAPVEETPAEEAPVEEAPVEEAPVEEAPVEEAPVEEAPAE